MKQSIQFALYIFLLTGIAFWEYYSLQTFALRYKNKAVQKLANEKIDSSLYNVLLDILDFDINIAPIQNAPLSNEDSFFQISSKVNRYNYTVNAAKFNKFINDVNENGSNLIFSFAIKTIPFAILSVFLSLLIALVSEYYEYYKFLNIVPHMIEGIPIILILFYFYNIYLNSIAWYGSMAIVMIPVIYRPIAALVRDIKNKNIIDGERMFAIPEWLIISRLTIASWPVLLSGFFFFLAMALMIDTCMNFILSIDFGEPNISTCLGKSIKLVEENLIILNDIVISIRNEFLLLSSGCICFCVLCQKFILLFASTAKLIEY